MSIKRIIARLDIKGSDLIKTIQLEGLRKIGAPEVFAKKYYDGGIDEIIYMDTVASLYGRNHLSDLVKRTVKNVFVPITVGGGIRTLKDAISLLKCGADKIAVNTAAVKKPDLINEIANELGNQCFVLSIEAKNTKKNYWEVYIENGRQPTGISVQDWVLQTSKRGVGEILLTSIDNEGTGKGFDYNLLEMVTNSVNIPIIASGGMGSLSHFKQLCNNINIDAIAMANIIHYNKFSISEIKNFAVRENIKIRK